MKYSLASERKPQLVILAILSIGLCLLAVRFSREVARPMLAQKLDASRKMLAAQKVILDERKRLGVPFGPDDTEHTGWIGDSKSVLTTEVGYLPSKKSTANPNFGAALVEMIAGAGVKKGDVVAIGMTGSFPALDAAAIVGVEELGARPIIISSVGASQWGANQPRFTWLEMERALRKAGIIHHRSSATGTGGSRALDSATLQALKAAASEGVRTIDDTLLTRGIERRLSTYDKRSHYKPIALFINVGGAIANVGVPQRSNQLASIGVMGEMKKRGVPTLDLRGVRKLCQTYHLPYDPKPIPPIGTGALYYSTKAPPLVAAGCLIALLVLTFVLTTRRLPGVSSSRIELDDVVPGGSTGDNPKRLQG